ncbi:exosortase N [Chitinophaga costaii]|uniref:Exosortase N n=1 Tax=Chitinophaga costaii TaxID=1335309 RepID=A0A1C4EUX9_9BACT|nr:exosortase N [Chitinophaga costaii]SCC47455.1 exosortase N [Chitinophaga costaii]
MIAALPRERLYAQKWWILFATAYLLITLYWMRRYLDPLALHFQLGCLALVVCTRIDRSRKGRYRFGIAALCFAVLTWCIPVKTFALLTVTMGLLFAVESFVGSLNLLPLLIIPLMSPLAEYAVKVFSFPLRLEMTQWAGRLLQMIGLPVQVEGNMVTCNGVDFTVDPACMGLHMLLASLLAGIMLVAITSKKYQRRMGFGFTVLLLLPILVLNMIANVLRIATIVYFQAMPGTLLHDLIGLFCFGGYVILPSFFLIRFAIQRVGQPVIKTAPTIATPPHKGSIMANSLLLLLVLGINTLPLAARASRSTSLLKPPTLAGFRYTLLDENITKLNNDQLLVYIKPIRGFYASDHNPSICWEGSGYTFQQVTEQNQTYHAVLTKGDVRLYTAWWYDNGEVYTNSQWSWRLDALRHRKRYAIINITATNKQILAAAIGQFRKEKIYRQSIRASIPPPDVP